MEVQSPPSTTIGYVVQNWHPFKPKLSILGAAKETLLTIEGPFCACSCCGDVDFEVKSSPHLLLYVCIAHHWLLGRGLWSISICECSSSPESVKP